MSPTSIATFVVAVAAQLAGIAVLPYTRGFTHLGPTIAVCLLFSLGVGALARLTHSGVELGILIPLMSAVIPLSTIFIGILLHGESASPIKLTLLGASCVLVGIAASRG